MPPTGRLSGLMPSNFLYWNLQFKAFQKEKVSSVVKIRPIVEITFLSSDDTLKSKDKILQQLKEFLTRTF